jgi:outer membrane putative beta-barrel porin/alpha-amylase
LADFVSDVIDRKPIDNFCLCGTYFYQQLTADSGAAPILGEFKSRVAGIGPQLGYQFPVGKMYLNLKGYWEFDAKNRPEGWNTWLTFPISPAAKPAPSSTRTSMVTKLRFSGRRM